MAETLMTFNNNESTQKSSVAAAWWDSLPEPYVKQILDGVRSGIPKAVVLRWLRAEGIEGATKHRLQCGIDLDAGSK